MSKTGDTDVNALFEKIRLASTIKLGGVINSMHTKGLAADFRTEFSPDIETMYNYLNTRREKFQITELIKYERFIHMAVSQSLTI